VLLAVIVAFAFALAGCGSKSSSSAGAGSGASAGTTTSAVGTISNTKAKFVLHAGLAFGAFHHFIYLPFRAGDFSHPFSHKLTIVKAGLAAVFVVHEVKLAYADANADPTLSKLTAPLNALGAKLEGLVSQVKSGHVNAADLSSAQGAVSSVSSLASGAGASITEAVPHL
jgi:hypothetical protein